MTRETAPRASRWSRRNNSRKKESRVGINAKPIKSRKKWKRKWRKKLRRRKLKKNQKPKRKMKRKKRLRNPSKARLKKKPLSKVATKVPKNQTCEKCSS